MKTCWPLVLTGVAAGVFMLPSSARSLAAQERPLTYHRIHVEIPSLPLDTYASVATEIVRGRVVAAQAYSHRGGYVARDVEIEVLDVLKGDPGDTLHAQVVGGELGVHVTIAAAAPELRSGDEAVFFLEREPTTGERGIVGLAQGVYRVSDIAGVTSVVGLHAPAGTALSDFESDVRRLVATSTSTTKPR